MALTLSLTLSLGALLLVFLLPNPRQHHRAELSSPRGQPNPLSDLRPLRDPRLVFHGVSSFYNGARHSPRPQNKADTSLCSTADERSRAKTENRLCPDLPRTDVGPENPAQHRKPLKRINQWALWKPEGTNRYEEPAEGCITLGVSVSVYGCTQI